MTQDMKAESTDSATNDIVKHKGVAIARRAVFAGLGLAAANIALGIIDPTNSAFIASASATTPLDVWIEDQPSVSSYMTQRCYHMVTLGADGNYFVRVKTSITSNLAGERFDQLARPPIDPGSMQRGHQSSISLS